MPPSLYTDARAMFAQAALDGAEEEEEEGGREAYAIEQGAMIARVAQTAPASPPAAAKVTRVMSRCPLYVQDKFSARALVARRKLTPMVGI